jgi:hypothetical protein
MQYALRLLLVAEAFSAKATDARVKSTSIEETKFLNPHCPFIPDRSFAPTGQD